jgi:hypothetical protein
MKMMTKLIGGIAVALATGLTAFAVVSALHLKDDGASGLLCFLLWVAQVCVIEGLILARKVKAKVKAEPVWDRTAIYGTPPIAGKLSEQIFKD